MRLLQIALLPGRVGPLPNYVPLSHHGPSLHSFCYQVNRGGGGLAVPTEPKSSSSPATYGDELVGCQDIMKNYSFVIHCTGLLWYAKLSVSNSTKWATPYDCQKYSVPKLIFFVGDLLPPGKLNYTKSSKENYHVFWNNTFSGLGIKDNIMMIGSAPTNNITPVGRRSWLLQTTAI